MIPAYKSFFHKKNYIKSILLIAALSISILIYYPGLKGDFVHDDIPNLIQNDKLHINTLNYDSLITASFSSKSGPLRRPVSMFTFSLNYYFSKLNPFSYKVVNLLIHILTGLSLFLLTSLLLNSYEKIYRKSTLNVDHFYIALFVAFAWLVSPINFTGVLYIVQRMTSLAALFSIAGLCLYVLARRSMIFENKLKIHLFLFSALLFILSIFSKETGALSIFYVICIEVCFFKFKSDCIISPNVFKILFITLIATPILIILIYLINDSAFIMNGYNHRSFTLEERVLTQARMLFLYLKWIALPNITELGLYHDDIVLSKSITEPLTSLTSVIGIIGIFLTSLVLIKRKPLIAFSILFFLSSHVIESSVIALELAYEHRNYLASYGVIFGITTSLIYIIKNKTTLKYSLLIGCLWVCAIATTTGLRSFQWQSNASLVLYEAEHHPKSARAIFSLASLYANMTITELINEKDKALELFETSAKYMPHEIIAEASAILFSSLVGEKPDSRWIENITEKLHTLPLTQNTITSLSEINKCILSTCTITTQQVSNFYEAALSNKTTHTAKNKSDLLTLYAKFSADKLRGLDTAHNAMLEAIKVSPDILQYRVNYATLLLLIKDYNQAESVIRYIENNDTFKLHKKQIKALKEDLSRLRIEATNLH